MTELKYDNLRNLSFCELLYKCVWVYKGYTNVRCSRYCIQSVVIISVSFAETYIVLWLLHCRDITNYSKSERTCYQPTVNGHALSELLTLWSWADLMDFCPVGLGKVTRHSWRTQAFLSQYKVVHGWQFSSLLWQFLSTFLKVFVSSHISEVL